MVHTIVRVWLGSGRTCMWAWTGLQRPLSQHRNAAVTPAIQELLMVHKIVRNRSHGLMLNTLPEPILVAIGAGDSACVRVYPRATVLQADNVAAAVGRQ